MGGCVLCNLTVTEAWRKTSEYSCLICFVTYFLYFLSCGMRFVTTRKHSITKYDFKLLKCPWFAKISEGFSESILILGTLGIELSGITSKTFAYK